jgi:hypothetical protein
MFMTISSTDGRNASLMYISMFSLLVIGDKNIQWLEKKIRDFSPQAIYTDRATATCCRSLVPTFADRGCRVVSAMNPHSCYFQISRPDPLSP